MERSLMSTSEDRERLLTQRPDLAELYDQEFYILDMSVRVWNCLRRDGFRTAGEIIQLFHDKSADEVHIIRNFGVESRKEVVNALIGKQIPLSVFHPSYLQDLVDIADTDVLLEAGFKAEDIELGIKQNQLYKEEKKKQQGKK